MNEPNFISLKLFQEIIIYGKSNVSKDVLRFIEIYFSNSNQEFGKIIFKKDILGDCKVNFMNKCR
jgi:hypothetical protein